MSTLPEITAAIERLPETDLAVLAAWLQRFRSLPRVEPLHHHDLDALIGTWKEDEGFERAQRAFSQVDHESWR